MGFDILVVDDEASMRTSLARVLRANGYSVRLADCAHAAVDAARKQGPDLVLLDICLPDASGLEVLTQLKRMNQDLVIIAMTAHENVKDAVVAIKGGAYDYLSKPFNIDAVRLLIKQALAAGKAKRERRVACAPPWQASACNRMIATSPAMNRVLDIIHRLPVHSGSSVLIEGETGTGKELLAHAIHEVSGRANEPFVAIGCGAIPHELMESELFGYEKGAYTGAHPDGKPGVFEQAAGGTILLDELGELALNLQVKLLRVLEAREFCRVGGLRSTALRARLIAATNRNLQEEVDEGRFRADLYYRLNVVRITLPPLRERRGDVLPLAESFLREFSAAHGKRFVGISRAARDMLESYCWPGNVRELRNVIERIVLLESGDEVLPDHLSGELMSADRNGTPSVAVDDCSGGKLLDIEREHILQTLKRTDGNVAKAARLLGLKRGALRYRMDKFGIAKRSPE